MTQKLLIALVAALLAVALTPARAAFNQDDLLEPEKAFEISTRALDQRTAEVRFRIADGYYMYRDRFKFETASGKLLSDVELPPGILKKDPFFGETQTYRREAVLRVPLSDEDVQRGRVKLKVTSQGCSDSGVCYVPLEQIVDVKLAGASPSGGIVAAAEMRSWFTRGWLQALLGAAALAALVLSLRFAPAAAALRARARATQWFYPGVAFALATLLVLAAYPLLAPPLRDFAWGALLVMLGVWLRAIDALPQGAGGAARVAKGVGVLALTAGAVLIAFAAGWRTDLNEASAPGVAVQAEAPDFERVASLEALDARLASATRPTMLDFYADWCVTCKEMERFTFSDPAVAERMRRFQLLQVDVTRNTESDKAFLKRFGIFGPPAILFFDTAGNELRALRVIGFQSAERFAPTLEHALRPTSQGRLQ